MLVDEPDRPPTVCPTVDVVAVGMLLAPHIIDGTCQWQD